MNVGQVHDKDVLFLRVDAGTAKSDENNFQLSINLDHSPLILCEETGKWFSLSWKDILALAVEAGISRK